VLNGALYALPYDIVTDFTPISLVAMISFVLLSRKSFPANDLRELIDWLKAHPEMASAAITITSLHLLTASFQKQTGTRFALVPYRGGAPAMQDLVAGHIDLLFDTPLQFPLVRAGSIKAFAVTTALRSVLAPDIPTFTEMGLPELSLSGWYALFAPKGTPRNIIIKLNAAVVEGLSDPAVRSRLASLGYDVFPREQQTPEALETLQKTEVQKWWPLIKEFGIKAE